MLLGVDVGGTFTDAVLVDADGTVRTAKLPSTPSEQSHAVLAAVHALLAQTGIDAEQVQRFAHGMTVATNALLEGRTARTALLTTHGFTDVIELARQNRPHLYRLCEAPPAPLVAPGLRFGVRERMGVDGPLQVLEPQTAEKAVQELARSQPQAVAVALLHSYADPTHERVLAEALARHLPDTHVSLSCELVGTFREYERTATTVLDAALSPLLRDYLSSLSSQAHMLGLREPHVMQSSGGLTDAASAGAPAALTVLSGPAGGVGGALALAELAGEPDVLCFDMGGTSCDVCAIERAEVPESTERMVAGRPLALPALDIHTVGAGGGSIAWSDAGGALRVGPASAGADPGPACYGRGGREPTVTDANLLLGRLLADSPLAGGLTLDLDAAERAVSRLARELELETLACAEGIVRVAEAQMLGALRVMSVERGVDPRGFALMPFGGAGPLHATALARELGISRVLCPSTCGVLSALGLAAAAPRWDAARTLMLELGSLAAEQLSQARERLVQEAAAALAGTPVRVRVRHELRYRGQSFELSVEEELSEQKPLTPPQLEAEFASAHERRYGYRERDAKVELVNMRASVWGERTPLRPRARTTVTATAIQPATQSAPELRPVIFDGRPLQTAIHRGALPPGSTLEGPAVYALPEATLLVEPGWVGTVDEHGTIRLHDASSSKIERAGTPGASA